MIIQKTEKLIPGVSPVSKLFTLFGQFKKQLGGYDFYILLLLTVLFNLPLLIGKFSADFVFFPGQVAKGEIWRLFTHAFVHVSPYHLALDAGAFFFLYFGLQEQKVFKRVTALLFCTAGSILAVILFSPQVSSLGLCGLSGAAHGLMVITNLEMITEEETRKAGLISLGILTAKVIYEAATGRVFFEFLHFGMCGSPQAASHPGGFVGGLLFFAGLMAVRKLVKKMD